MTAGNNGASKPEDDDPFGYLYADGQAAGAQAPGQGGYGYPGPAAQPGVPRTSYNQVRAVGERQYGQQQVPQQQGGYGYPPQQAYGQPAQQYNRPNPQYAAPETYPGGAAHGQPPAQGGHGGGTGRGGPNTKALLIAAVAVVAVVLIGIGAALLTGDDGDKDDKNNEASSSQGPAGEVEESKKPEKKPKETQKPVELPKQDAATLTLGGPATVESSIEGAQGGNGAYVTGFNHVGSSVTWRAEMKSDGEYRLAVRYAVPAKDADATLTVNGKKNSQPIGLKNFIKSSDPEWEKNWQTTWAPVTLQTGQNEIKLSCETGNQCEVILDWVEVTQATS
ncbi:CBM35 domain-containing protein [Streptomyces sp. Cmuel-A718b]|uniref:CBM35 domain-containing protein n=1 Tax=Streptomyces sp. Cmuel-A718b TaxID=697328 RepID=UPI00081D938D|nr:CBM35 domain-containing protein [Streptomyces sp. Cmuel-A718b]SCF91814.1 Carbohydrate binding module (family 35) [Streptomyces sp. Cmuel-A718b]